jgi:hypothetical protein
MSLLGCRWSESGLFKRRRLNVRVQILTCPPNNLGTAGVHHQPVPILARAKPELPHNGTSPRFVNIKSHLASLIAPALHLRFGP